MMLNLTNQASKQSGIALLTVLLIVFLASTIAVSMIDQHTFDIRRTDYNENFGQSYHLSMGVEAWALGKLHKDAKNDKTGEKTDHEGETWGETLLLKNINNIASVNGKISDEQGLFNINNLYFEDLKLSDSGVKDKKRYQYLYLRNLLEKLDINADLANPITDWLDQNSNASFPLGAEDSFYLTKKTAYRTAGRPIVHISELRLIKGITPQIYNKLKTAIVALPQSTRINVNTAPKRVLLGLTKTMTESMADNIIQHRLATPFKSTKDFIQFMQQGNEKKSVNSAELTQLLTVSSNYYVAKATVSMNRSVINIASRIWRDPKTALIKVYQRTRGLQ